MRFGGLGITNFLTIGSASMRLDNQGLRLIQGENLDDPSAISNGAGKSSLADALCWVLFDETARGVKGDEVINDIAGKNCKVHVEVLEEDYIYRVYRYRKHHEFKNALRVLETDKSGRERDMTLGTNKLTQEMLEKQILGCSLDVFRSSIYAGQEQMPDLPRMTDKFLKLLVEEAAGIDQLVKGYAIAKFKHRESVTKLEKLTTRHGDLSNSEKDAIERLHDAKKDDDTWSDDLIKAMKQFDIELDSLEGKLATFNKHLTTLSPDKVEAGLKKVRVKLNSYEGEQKKLVELVEVENEMRDKIHDMKREVTYEQKNVDRLLDEINNSVKEGADCSACGRPFSKDDAEHAREHLKEPLKKARSKVAKATNHLLRARLAHESAYDKRKAFESSMTDISKIVSIQSDLEARQKKIDAVRNQIGDTTQAIKRKQNDRKEKWEEKSPYTKVIDRCKKELEIIRGEKTTIVKSITDKELETELLGDAVQVFGAAGVRAHILDTVTPYLNDRTAHYLSNLSDGSITAVWSTLDTTAKGDVREKFNIQVVNSKGAKSFAGLSGGEKRKVRLATAMALQDLVASRATKPIDLFVADEIDDALDDAGLERLMGLLDEKAKERGTVLIISHNELSDWIRDSFVIRKEGGKATIVKEE